jgi:predicted porin
MNRDFDSIIGKVGLENAFTPNTMGTLLVGYQYATYDASGIDSQEEPYLKAAIETRTGSDLSVGASIGHGIRDTDAYPFTSQTYSEFDLFGDYNITPTLVLRGTGIYRLSEYDEDTIPVIARSLDFAGRNGGDDTTIVLDAVLDYNLLENLSLYAGYRYEDVDSEVGQSYTKNTGRVGAALKF